MQSHKERIWKIRLLQTGVACNFLVAFKLTFVPTLTMAVWTAFEVTALQLTGPSSQPGSFKIVVSVCSWTEFVNSLYLHRPSAHNVSVQLHLSLILQE
jgi:hypothetical protein